MGKFEPKGKNILGDAIDFYTEDNEIGSVEEIDIDLLKPFHDHPFKLYEGERLNDMVESIKTYGVMTPVIVRKMKKDYEILAGHNRTNAARLAGLSKVPCIVKDKLTDEEAYVYVIETNLIQRSFGDLSTSEKAVVLKERYDNIKSQGKRNDIIRELKKLNGEEIEEPADDSSNRDDIAGEYGLSGATMARLLRVNYLTCDMKTAVDNGKLPLLSAVNLSYIDDNAQCDVYSVMKESGVKVNENMSRKIRTLFESGDFDLTACRNIMIHPEKIVTNQKVSVSSSTFSKYFAGKKKKEIEDIIEKALAAYLG